VHAWRARRQGVGTGEGGGSGKQWEGKGRWGGARRRRALDIWQVAPAKESYKNRGHFGKKNLTILETVNCCYNVIGKGLGKSNGPHTRGALASEGATRYEVLVGMTTDTKR